MAKKKDAEFAEYVGPILRRIRNIKGKTMKDVSEDTGIAQGYLSRAERGQHALSMDKLSQLADYYEVPLTHFFPTEAKDSSKIFDIQKELWAARYLAFDGETVELTKEFIEQLESAIRMGIAWAQKSQETKGKGP